MKYLATRGELEYRKIFHSGEVEEIRNAPEVLLNVVTMRAHNADVGYCESEFVHVTDNFIYVVIDCDLIDDAAVNKAIEMVSELPNQNPGTIKVFEQAVQNENKISRSKRTH